MLRKHALALAACAIATVVGGVSQALEPESPRTVLDVAFPAAGGATITVPAGGDLQAALHAARPGDTIVLAAGATYSRPGGFYLPRKAGDGWIVIRTSNMAGIPPEGTRVDPGVHRRAMPKLVTVDSAPAIRAADGAHHYRLVGLEVAVPSGRAFDYTLVALGPGAPTSPDQIPHDLVIDRCYIHGSGSRPARRGVALNAARAAVVDSYISAFHHPYLDSQAIAGWTGPGPFKIVNNYLEASAENVLFGGADPRIAGLVPSDIEFRRNRVAKPQSWRPGEPGYSGTYRMVKNLFELKSARRVLVEGNVFEHNWGDAQNGFAILFTPRSEGRAPWSVVEDVTFANNVVRHVAAGINILGRDYNHPTEQTSRIVVRGNLFEDVDGRRWNGNGTFLITTDARDVVVDHNTVLQSGNVVTPYGRPTAGFVFTNNIVRHNRYGVVGPGTATGNATIARYLPGAVFRANVLAGAPAGTAGLYPPGNFFPSSLAAVGFANAAAGDYRLAGTSPYRQAGTDGRDIGADIAALPGAGLAVPAGAGVAALTGAGR